MASCATAARPAGRSTGPADGGLFKNLDGALLRSDKDVAEIVAPWEWRRREKVEKLVLPPH